MKAIRNYAKQKVRTAVGLLLTIAMLGTALPVHAGGPDAEGPVSATTANDFAKNRIIVKFRKEINTSEVSVLMSSLGLVRDREFSRIGITSLNVLSGQSVTELVKELNKNDKLIEFAEPDYRHRAAVLPDDTSFNSLWGLNNTGQTGGTNDADIDAPEAWDTVTGDEAVIVAVIDSGVDYTHPDLIDNIWTNPAEIAGNGIDDDQNGYVDDIHGINTITGSGDPMDDDAHGTHVAGTIGAQGNNAEGVVGVAWDVGIIGVKFLDASGSGFTSDAIEGLEYLLALKQAGVDIKITNNSWGGGGFSTALEEAFDALGVTGTIHAIAAGNGNSDNDANPSYPSSYELDSIIAVGSTDHNDDRSSFSQWGATSVDIGAPGSSILSTVPGNGYDSFSGTSMATPHVAGALALLAAQFPSLSSTQLKARLLSTVDVKSQLVGEWLSNGRLNIDSAINCAPFSNGDAQINLLDDGVAPDLVVGDGIYTGTWAASGAGATTVSITSTNPALTATVDGTVVERILYTKTENHPYNWIDISSTGTPLGLTDDEVFFPIQYAFDFYGSSFSEVSVSANGVLGFSDAAQGFENAPIPVSAGLGPEAFIAPFWDDFDPSAGGDIYYEVQGSQLIVQWDNLNHYGDTTGQATFQVILDQTNGDILMQYNDVDFGVALYDNGASATVGLQQEFIYGQQHSHNEASLSNGQAILWSLGTDGGTPEITSPEPGDTLAAGDQLFNWQSNGTNVDAWWLYAGSSPGGTNYFNSGDLGLDTSVTVPSLPTNGSDVYIRLWYLVEGSWLYLDEVYIASSIAPETFSWQANGATVSQWWLYAGSTEGSRNYYDSGSDLGGALSTTVTGLPTDGSQVYIRLWYKVGATWLSIDEQYTAASIFAFPTINSPEPGDVLAGSSVVFDWQANGAAVDNWWIYAGSALGSRNYYDSSNLFSSTSTTVTGTNGSAVYIRLWYQVGSTWLFIDEQYTAAGVVSLPTITSPAPGTNLAGSSVVFDWQANGESVDNWWIYAGSSVGASNYYDSGNLFGSTSTTVTELPTDGSDVYIRLWYQVGTTWFSIDEQYTANDPET